MCLMILDECDGTIVRTSLSPRGGQMISRAPGGVAGEFSCWYSALKLPAFRILCFLYLLCCCADIWHG